MKAAALAAVLIALVALPPLAEPYVLHVAIVVLINVVYAEALYVIMRMGYLSFGHAGYIALGAYTSALLATKLDVSVWLGFLAGGAVAAVFAWLLGMITLKLRGIYFSLSVFAFAEVVNAIFRAFDVFGGPAGIADVPRPNFFGTRLNSHLGFYYVVLATAVISLAFLISGLLAGIAGVLWIARTTSVNPTTGFVPVIEAFIASVIGGLGNLRGAVLGGFFLGALEVFLAATLPGSLLPYAQAVSLLIVVGILYIRPQGLFGQKVEVT